MRQYPLTVPRMAFEAMGSCLIMSFSSFTRSFLALVCCRISSSSS